MTRQNSGWLAEPERRALDWMAPRLPTWISADHLTAVGFFGAVMAFVAYVLAPRNAAWLWMVNAGLIVNWLGDSLDGRVAHLRKVGRPRFGYFLDQSIDVVAQFLFALGLGLSGYVRLEIAALGLATFLMMTVQGLLLVEVTRVFHLAAAGIGLTEVRCAFFIANIAFYFSPPRPFEISGIVATYTDVLGVGWIAWNVGMYILAMVAQLKALASDEPGRPHTEAGGHDQ
jgi:archaetidylinositol phosphate synthase